MTTKKPIPPWVTPFVLAVAFCASASVAAAEPLGFEERVAAQEAIQRVYHRHRIWPNPGERPAFESAVTKEQLEKQVREYLKESNLLEKYWGRPLMGAQLQAELDRMCANTKAPDRLLEIFDALGNDPLLIAECVARPALSDRMLRSWFAWDDRIHGSTRDRAEELVKGIGARDFFSRGGDLCREVSFRLDDGAIVEDSRWIVVDGHEFRRLDHLYPPAGEVSGLIEAADAFEMRMTLRRSGRELEGAVIRVQKMSFDDWFEEVSAPAPVVQGPGDVAAYTLPTPGGGQERFESGGIPPSWDSLWYVPEHKEFHVAVWTGSEMIVWGDIYSDAGGCYDPVLDAWTATSRTFAPSPRRMATAV